MSGQETMGATIIGKLTGFTKRWNPFSTEVFALVEVDTKVINVPIDYRQKRIVQMEHPIDSLVPLAFNEGKWEILSQMETAEHKVFIDSTTVF
jgi:cAMP phosphodiesterase